VLPLVASLACMAAPAVGDRSTAEIDQAFTHMYNTDFHGAHAYLDRYVSAQPSDPFGYAVLASAYLFSELDRLGILESEFFENDKRIITKKGLRPDPAVRAKFFQAVEEAQSRGTRILAANTQDQNALFAMAITQGVLMDYTALVEKRQLSSLSSARRANSYAQQLLKINPQFYDAYLTTGLNEYLLGSLPFFVRWFVHFDGVNGSKNQGIENLKLVARSGHYLRPFAKILLAICYLREKQPRETQKLLAALTTEFPENPLLRKELAKVSAELEHGGSADGK
jgi:predicted Zn-dependent protease